MPLRHKEISLLVVAGVFLFAKWLMAGDIDRQGQIEAIINEAKKQYALQLAYRDVPVSSRRAVIYTPAADADGGDLLGYLRIFEEEVARYPKSFFEKSRLKGVV